MDASVQTRCPRCGFLRAGFLFTSLLDCEQVLTRCVFCRLQKRMRRRVGDPYDFRSVLVCTVNLWLDSLVDPDNAIREYEMGVPGKCCD